MNTTASAGDTRLRVAVCIWVAGWIALAQPLSVVAASDGGWSTAYLDFTVSAQPVALWTLSLNREAKAFQKEPNTSGRKVCRGSFSFGDVGGEPTAFLWDYTRGKIYVDLNHNRDLTDDPQGALSCPVSRYNYYVQSFTNLQLTVSTPRGLYPLCVDLRLYGPDGNGLAGNAGVRSFWAGRMTLGNRDYQVGRIDRVPGQFGRDNEGALLLRPWEERGEPFDLMNGSLDAFDYTQNLFFGGQGYRVDCLLVEQDQKTKFKVSFREKEAELGEVKLTGEFIERLVFAAKRERQRSFATTRPENRSGFTVVLDRPEGVVRVPVGEYEQCRVSVKSGGVSAYNEFNYYNSSGTAVTVSSSQPAVVGTGGPLTNSVLVSAHGKNLSLNYRLLGGGGEAYQLAKLDRSRPPRFVIYRNGARVHSGKFEFG